MFVGDKMIRQWPFLGDVAKNNPRNFIQVQEDQVLTMYRSTLIFKCDCVGKDIFMKIIKKGSSAEIYYGGLKQIKSKHPRSTLVPIDINLTNYVTRLIGGHFVGLFSSAGESRGTYMTIRPQ